MWRGNIVGYSLPRGVSWSRFEWNWVSRTVGKWGARGGEPGGLGLWTVASGGTSASFRRLYSWWKAPVVNIIFGIAFCVYEACGVAWCLECVWRGWQYLVCRSEISLSSPLLVVFKHHYRDGAGCARNSGPGSHTNSPIMLTSLSEWWHFSRGERVQVDKDNESCVLIRQPAHVQVCPRCEWVQLRPLLLCVYMCSVIDRIHSHHA